MVFLNKEIGGKRNVGENCMFSCCTSLQRRRGNSGNLQRLKNVMESLNEPYEIYLSTMEAKTEQELSPMKYVTRINRKAGGLCKKFGHQTAITAGMDYSEGEAIVVIDADLQDPPELIPKMIEKWREGYDVVYGKRKERKGETFFKSLRQRYSTAS